MSLQPDPLPALRPATAMEIAMGIVEDAQEGSNRAAFVRACHLVAIANAIAQEGRVTNLCDPDKLRSRVQRQYVFRPHWFLPPDCNTEANVLALAALEFEADGDLICLRKRAFGPTGTRSR